MYKNILVVNLMHIGDLLLVTPVLRTLRTTYPQAKITLLADAKLADLVKLNQNINELLPIDKKGIHDKIGNYLHFLMDIRRRKYDLVINLHRNERASFLAAFSGAKKIVGYASPGLGVFYDCVIPNRKAEKHQVEAHFDVLRECLGLTEMDDRGIEMWLDDSAIPRAQKIWDKLWSEMTEENVNHRGQRDNSEISVQDSQNSVATDHDGPSVGYAKDGKISDDFPVIALNIGASWPTKRWGKDQFAELADRLIDKGFGIVFLGGTMDQEIVAEAQGLMQHKDSPVVKTLTGKLSLMELAAVLRHCAVFVTNDSGPMHVATAMDVPVVTMFGASPVPGFYPYNTSSVLLKTPSECHPCGEHKCPRGTLECMTKISVETVLQYTLQLYEQYGSRPVGGVPRQVDQHRCTIVEL